MNKTNQLLQFQKTAFRNSILCLSIGIAILGTSSGSSVKTINLPEMTDSAGIIFYGKCVAAETAAIGGIPAKRYSFQVIEALKGVESGQIFTFHQIAASGAFRIPGIPDYHKGQELLLFLHPDSRLGLTSPVGLGQGCFRPMGLPDGRIGYINAYRNQNLSARLNGGSISRGLGVRQLDLLQASSPISLADFKELVSHLQRFRKIGEEAN